jgi:predicted DNA-binding transcriptional regulator AlpA
MSSTQHATAPDNTRDDDELLTMQEVADVVRVPVATLRYWRQLGTGPRSFRIGRSVRYWRREVFVWLDDQAMVTARASCDIIPLADVAPVSDRLDGRPDQLSQFIGAAAVELMRQGEDGQR